MKLTLYLFRASVGNFDHCLKPQTESRKYRDITNGEMGGITEDFRIYMMEKPAIMPKWATFFGNYIQSDAYNSLMSAAPATVILFRIKSEITGEQRIMAATNGAAYAALDGSLVERNFGLRTTLNSIAPHRIKSLEYRGMQSQQLQRRESSANATSIANFGFAYDNEMIKSVSGRAVSDELGRSITGAHSLKITVPDIQISQLQQVGEIAFSRYNESRYKEHFDFIDHLEQLSDPMTVELLNATLIDAVSGAVPGKGLGVNHNNQAQYVDCEHLQLTVRGVKERFDEIDISSLHTFLQNNAGEITLDTLKSEAYLYGNDSSDKPITRKQSVLKLLSFQTHADDESVINILRDGQWYGVQPDFFAESKAWLSSAIDQSPMSVPSWGGDIPEQHFALDLGGDFLPLTKEWLIAKGRGQIYVADAYDTKNNNFISLKRTGSAVSLDHLVDRTIVAAEMIRDQDGKMMDFISRTAHATTPESREKLIPDLGFVFCIAYEQNIIEELNFFDYIALQRGVKALRRLGFKTSISPIKLS